MVVDADGDLSNALVGGIMTLCAAQGSAGMVLDGAIRDVAEIRERPFPVYARGVIIAVPTRTGPGQSTSRYLWAEWLCLPATSSLAIRMGLSCFLATRRRP